MPNAQNVRRPAAGAGGFRIVAFPKEFERNIWETLDRRFYIILLISFAFVYGIVIYFANTEYSQAFVDDQIRQKYLKKFYEAEFVQEPFAEAEMEEGVGGLGEDEGEEEIDERARRDEGRRAEATGSSAAERRAMRRQAAAQRGRQRDAMQQAVAGTGVLAELSAGGGGGGTGDAVYDVLGEGGGGGGFGNLDEVLKGVGGLQSASSGSRRSQLGARVSGGGGQGAAGIDNLIEGGIGGSGSVSIKRRGGFKIKVAEASVSGKAAKAVGRSPDAISRIVNKHADAIENCYKKESRLNPNLTGSITVQFTISPNGRVSRARVLDSTLRNRTIESCVVKTIRRWRFQKIDQKEGDVTFKQKFIFIS